MLSEGRAINREYKEEEEQKTKSFGVVPAGNQIVVVAIVVNFLFRESTSLLRLNSIHIVLTFLFS